MNKSRNIDGTFKKRVAGEMFEGFPVYKDRKGYKIIWLDGRNVKVHVFVWERHNGPKPDGLDIHHIDKDKGNYDISNLQLLSKSDHQKIHSGWIMTDGEWSHKPCSVCKKVLSLDNFYPRKGYTPTANCKPCHIIKTNKWARQHPEKVKAIKRKSYNLKKGGENHDL